jgi:simple sugar transport system permease protein
MSVQAPPATVEPAESAQSKRPLVMINSVAARATLALLLVLVVLSLTRMLSDKPGLTAPGALGGAITAAVPIMLAGLGGLWSERSGIVNIGLEGQMILGTWFAAYFAWHAHNAWMLIVGGIFGGLIGGVLHAIATVAFRVDQIISGVAINILAPGVAKYLSGIFFTSAKSIADGGGQLQSPKVEAFSTLEWHAADRWLTKITHHHWFFVSDVAGLLDGLVTELNVFTLICLALIPLSWFVLWRTSFGLRLRSCGENPTAAETLGVKVYTMKAVATIVSGVLAGIAGAFLVDYTGIYRDGQTSGRGFIGLAAMIFGNWRPGGLLAGSSLFGYADNLRQQYPTPTVHALLLVVAILLALVAAYHAYKRRTVAATVSVVIGGLVLLWYLTTDSIPDEFATYSPQIITLVVLALASQRLRMPTADGLPWRRGQGA